jgi:hypothetical protein
MDCIAGLPTPPTSFSMETRRAPVIRNDRLFVRGRQETSSALSVRWSITLNWQLTRVDAPYLIAFLQSLRARGAKFPCYHLARPNAYNMSGAPMLASPTWGNTMSISGLPNSTLVLRTGDMLKVSGELVQVCADVISDATGHAQCEFAPSRRTTANAGAIVEYNSPTVQFTLSGDPSITRNDSGVSAMITATEVT